jgi:hypothetical protein
MPKIEKLMSAHDYPTTGTNDGEMPEVGILHFKFLRFEAGAVALGTFGSSHSSRTVVGFAEFNNLKGAQG